MHLCLQFLFYILPAAALFRKEYTTEILFHLQLPFFQYLRHESHPHPFQEKCCQLFSAHLYVRAKAAVPVFRLSCHFYSVYLFPAAVPFRLYFHQAQYFQNKTLHFHMPLFYFSHIPVTQDYSQLSLPQVLPVSRIFPLTDYVLPLSFQELSARKPSRLFLSFTAPLHFLQSLYARN